MYGMWHTLKEMTLKPSMAVHASGKQSSRTKADYFQSRIYLWARCSDVGLEAGAGARATAYPALGRSLGNWGYRYRIDDVRDRFALMWHLSVASFTTEKPVHFDCRSTCEWLSVRVFLLLEISNSKSIGCNGLTAWAKKILHREWVGIPGRTLSRQIDPYPKR